MIRIILTLLAGSILGLGSLSAQTVASYRDRLAVPTTAEGSYRQVAVTVTESDDAAEALSRASREGARLRFKGYRVCIFFDNGENARGGAESARGSFAAAFPDVKSHMAYNSPYFTVTVGDCATSEEAIILMGRIKSNFPKAFIKNEELSIADLLR